MEKFTCCIKEVFPTPLITPPIDNTPVSATTNTSPQTKNKQISSHDNTYGHYSGVVQTEWLPKRKMKLLNTITFIAPDGTEWIAPKGSIVDGASIPRLLWSMMGSPFSGKYRNASVIHDIACDEKKRAWKDVHKTFYYAMRTSGVNPLRASIMYAAVNNFGPRWGGTRGKPRLSEDSYKKLVAEIEKREAAGNPMSLDEIRKF